MLTERESQPTGEDAKMLREENAVLRAQLRRIEAENRVQALRLLRMAEDNRELSVRVRESTRIRDGQP